VNSICLPEKAGAYLHFSQTWLATPQEVLHADWQEVWHSPQPPVLRVLFRSRVLSVLILFMVTTPSKTAYTSI
jgi:hypothetical protein